MFNLLDFSGTPLNDKIWCGIFSGVSGARGFAFWAWCFGVWAFRYLVLGRFGFWCLVLGRFGFWCLGVFIFGVWAFWFLAFG